MLRNPFHLYPQPKGALADRPWWTYRPDLARDRVSWCYLRLDGARVESDSRGGGLRFLVTRVPGRPDGEPVEGETYDTILARVDRDAPRPPPQPLVGQVWSDGFREDTIVTVNRSGLFELGPSISNARFASGGFMSSSPREDTDKDGWVNGWAHGIIPWPWIVLVAGPGAPWAPSDWLSPADAASPSPAGDTP